MYPGSFDPVTNGHLDIIDRASKLCEKLIVAVLVNNNKTPIFTIEERVDLLKCALGDRENVVVESFSGLLIDFVKERKAKVIVKGLRAVSDFEYELQMAHLNKIQDPEIETLFMMTSVNHSYLSSSMVKELARLGGKVDELIPDCIKGEVFKKYNRHE